MKFIFKSLFNNNAVLEGRKQKWWLGLLIFVISMILSVIPTMVSVGTAKGSSFLKNNTMSCDVGLKEFVSFLNTEDINLTVQENESGNGVKRHLIISSESDLTDKTGDNPLYEYHHFDGNTSVLRLSVYYRDETYKETTTFIQSIQSRVYEKGNENESEETVEQLPPTSFLVLGKERIYMAIYGKDVEKWNAPTSQYTGDYTKIALNTNIKNFSNSEDKVFDNWKEFFNDGYLNLRSSALVVQTTAYLGINALVTFFMGLMIFIITRGKKNPFRHEYNFGKSMLVISFAALCPAILTCILGFAFSSFAPMLYMIILGFRTMWMSSKNLNPTIAYQK